MFALILIIVIISLVLYCTIFKIRSWCYIVKKINEFPGRKGYPIVGNSLEFLGSTEDVFKEIRKNVSEYTAIGAFRSWLFVYPVVWVHDPQDMERLLGNVANNEKSILYNALRPWLGNGLLTSSGQQWHSRRKLLTPTFHFSILQNFLNIFNRESRHLVEVIKGHLNEEIDIKPIIFNFTLDSICETSMGVRLSNMKDANNYRNCVHQFGQIALERMTQTWMLVDWIFRLSSVYWKQKDVVGTLHNFSKTVIEERKTELNRWSSEEEVDRTSVSQKKQLALLDMLLLSQKKSEDLDDDAIREEVDTFMFEGHDTTLICICFTLMLLAENRDSQDKVHEEIISVFGNDDREPTYMDLQELKYMERCIKESLRLYPSVPLISRTIGEDIVTQNGHVIPKGSIATACIYDMHRRADLYPEPMKFNPDRFLKENCVNRHPYAYIPFSAGPRNCIGQKFAMMELKCVLTEILRHLIIQPVRSAEDISCVIDLVLRSKDQILLKFIRRN